MKISVIVPIFNSEKYINKCLDSIINQTYKNLEIILVNDGSTDNTINILEKYKNKDKRIKIINQKNSGGVIARKNGVDNATGKYVLIMDSDDWIEATLISEIVKKIKNNPDVEIVKFGYYYEPYKSKKQLLDSNSNDVIITKNNMQKPIYSLIYKDDYNQIWNQLIKRDLFDFDSFIFKHIVHKGEDLQINLQLYSVAKSLLVTNECYYHYVYNPNSVTNNYDVKKIVNNIKDNIYINSIREKIALDFFGECDFKRLQSRTISILINKIIYLLVYSDNLDEDLEYLKEKLCKCLSDYLSDYSIKYYSSKNIVFKKMVKNIINSDYCKLKKYKYLFKPLFAIKRVYRKILERK